MGELASLGAAALWAVASLIFQRAGDRMAPVVLNFVKCAFATILLWLALAVTEGVAWPRLELVPLSWLALSGVVGLAIGDTAYFNALVRLGLRRGLLLLSLAPPLTAILAAIFIDEPITWMMGLGICLTVGGVGWVVGERAGAGHAAGGSLAVGVSFGLLAALCQASGNIMVKLGGEDVSALAISVVRLAFGAATLSVQLLLMRRLGESRLVVDEPRFGARIAFATFLGTFLGIWLMMAGLKYAPAGVAATLVSTSPIFAIPLARIVLRETVSLRAWLGAMVAVAGVAVLFWFR